MRRSGGERGDPICPPSAYYRPTEKPKTPRDPSKPELDVDEWIGRIAVTVKYGGLALLAGYSVYQSGAIDGIFGWGDDEPSAEVWGAGEVSEEGIAPPIDE